MRTIYMLLFLVPFGAALAAESSEKSLIAEVEQAIVTRTNDFRKEHDLSPVRTNEALTETASDFATFMAESGKYGHQADGRSPAERAKSHDYKYCVVRENIAYRTNTGDVTAESLVEVFAQGWIESPPHRENMLADYVTETGVAVATNDDVTYYAVQLFGRPKSAAIEIKITNDSESTQTLVIVANDSEDEFQLPPRAVVTMKRCFPTTLKVIDREKEIRLTESATLTITEKGLTR